MNKPKGLKSQDDNNDSLERRMRVYLWEKGECEEDSAYIPSLCHRIDRNTSGLVIGAKNLKAHREVAENIKKKRIKKYYILTAEGIFPDKKGEISGYIKKLSNDKVVFLNKEQDGAKEASLKYRVIKQEQDRATVEVMLESGRTHQIRASFSHIGHPLSGDVKYGGAKRKDNTYQELCAYKLVFDFDKESNLYYLSGKEFVLNYE